MREEGGFPFQPKHFIKLMCSKFMIYALLAVSLVACQTSTVPMGDRSQHPGDPGNQRIVPDAPKLVRLPNGHYRVKRPWRVEFNGRKWIVPAGYTSNGITGPAKVRAMLGDGVGHRETWAAVFHDWLFTQSGNTRAVADRLFLDLLLAYGVDSGKARMMYSTVSAYSLSKNF